MAVVVTAISAVAPATAIAQPRPPTPEPNTAVNLLPRPCAREGNDPYEAKMSEREGWPGPEYERYPGACQRMRFSYGPIVVKPGQNDVLLGPVTIEKPNQDGYITRFKPNLVRGDGTVPPVDQVHLHHGTWLAQPDYGSGPFFAAGEEKTVAPFPRGYGMPIKATDAWELLHMVHSAVSQPMEVFITYDVDFIPQQKAEELGMKPAFPVWLDVRPSGYPVFNVQRDFGGRDGKCTWPKEKCASFDPFGKPFEGQGEPGNGKGTDFKFPKRGEAFGRTKNFTGGTLIGIGGHLHPGGLENHIDLVRPNQTIRVRRRKAGSRRSRWVRKRTDNVRIYTGQANYWNRGDLSRPGGPVNSWDFSMEVTGAPVWGVRVEPEDALRSNAMYDTTLQSTYEDMGIAVALMAPDDPEDKPTAKGVNPFKAKRDTSNKCKTGGLGARKPTLCDKGIVTHGHLPENENYGGPEGTWNARRGSPTSDVAVANFLYNPGDLSTISMTGVPTVKLGTDLRFTDAEGIFVYHTVTSCAFPCLGRTGTAFPLANGRTSSGRDLDFDSSEMGIGTPEIGPARQSLDWSLPVKREEGFSPGELVTYYCRIHPGMRGAFEVTGE